MGRLALAFKTFFRIFRDPELVQLLESKEGKQATLDIQKPVSVPKPVSVVTPRSEALTLLETLQREARLLDFLQEDLSEYNDSQVGAAVREIHRTSREVLKRCFEIEATVEAEEGEDFEVTEAMDPAEFRLIGNVTTARPVSGTLVHSGWKATKCQLPQWSGGKAAELIIAPAEVEIPG